MDRFSLIWISWNRNPDGSAFVEWNFRPELPYSLMELEWRERSRALFVLTRAGYVLPVLGDIATSPFQLIGVVIYFAAGGAVK